MTAQETKLLPCPFCGGEAVTGFVTGLSFHQYAGCNTCHMRCEARARNDLGSRDNEAMTRAVTRWNTRQAASQGSAGGERSAVQSGEPVAWRYRFVTSVDGKELSDWFIVDDPKSIPSREGQTVQPLYESVAQASAVQSGEVLPSPVGEAGSIPASGREDRSLAEEGGSTPPLAAIPTVAQAVQEPNDWQDDPSADERWNAGCDFALEQLCKFLEVDPSTVLWDAATETVDGDVRAVISHILSEKYGDNWSPKAAKIKDTLGDIAIECIALGMRKDESVVSFVRRLASPALPAEGSAPWSEDEQFAEQAKACRSRRKQYGQSHCDERDGSCTECEYDAQTVLRAKYPPPASSVPSAHRGSDGQ
jgi:hypothetical protein